MKPGSTIQKSRLLSSVRMSTRMLLMMLMMMLTMTMLITMDMIRVRRASTSATLPVSRVCQSLVGTSASASVAWSCPTADFAKMLTNVTKRICVEITQYALTRTGRMSARALTATRVMASIVQTLMSVLRGSTAALLLCHAPMCPAPTSVFAATATLSRTTIVKILTSARAT
eukprot:Rmarinus@m.25972